MNFITRFFTGNLNLESTTITIIGLWILLSFLGATAMPFNWIFIMMFFGIFGVSISNHLDTSSSFKIGLCAIILLLTFFWPLIFAFGAFMDINNLAESKQ
jgi:hypothetical protein